MEMKDAKVLTREFVMNPIIDEKFDLDCFDSVEEAVRQVLNWRCKLHLPDETYQLIKEYIILKNKYGKIFLEWWFDIN